VAAVLGLSIAACDDEKQPDPVDPGPTGPLTVTSVIADPKVAVPGDTLLFTAVITANAPNQGDFPEMTWTATGGTFLDTDKQTVRWASPTTAGVYTITVKATNNVSSSTNHASVFVGDGEELVPEFAGQIDLIGAGPDFNFFWTVDPTRGVDVRRVVGGVASDPIPPGPAPTPRPNLNTVYSPNGLYEAHAADSLQFATNPPPRHIYLGTFATGTYARLTVDGAKPLLPERNQFNHPAFSPNSQLVAYQRYAQSWEGAAEPDSFHVYVHDPVANRRTLVTGGYQSPRAFFPTFSTDGEWLVYVLDPNRSGQWELYGSPMNGNDVDTTLANVKKLTDAGGLITSGAPSADLRKPPMTWNPVSPVLAIAAADNELHLLQMTGSGGVDMTVPAVARPQEIVWSVDGSMLGTVFVETDLDGNAFSKIATVTTAGVATVRLTAPEGDAVRDIAFSPDGNWILYRVTRGSGSWFNVLDIGAGNLTEPVSITATDPAGNAAAYRGVMSLRPAWTNTGLMIYPAFNSSASGTPGIYTRDLRGLLD
jgi:Tol biopolymer transport system component